MCVYKTEAGEEHCNKHWVLLASTFLEMEFGFCVSTLCEDGGALWGSPCAQKACNQPPAEPLPHSTGPVWGLAVGYVAISF